MRLGLFGDVLPQSRSSKATAVSGTCQILILMGAEKLQAGKLPPRSLPAGTQGPALLLLHPSTPSTASTKQGLWEQPEGQHIGAAALKSIQLCLMNKTSNWLRILFPVYGAAGGEGGRCVPVPPLTPRTARLGGTPTTSAGHACWLPGHVELPSSGRLVSRGGSSAGHRGCSERPCLPSMPWCARALNKELVIFVPDVLAPPQRLSLSFLL